MEYPLKACESCILKDKCNDGVFWSLLSPECWQDEYIESWFDFSGINDEQNVIQK